MDNNSASPVNQAKRESAQIYQFQQKHEVRTVVLDGQPWFFAADVCTAVSLRDTNKAVLGLDDDERTEHEQYSGSGRKPLLINESGLYSLILRSRKPEAKAFRKWVTAEVLPSIRATGAYSRQETPQEVAELEEVITNIYSLTREGLNQIEAVASLALQALRTPAAYKNPESIARALEVIQAAALNYRDLVEGEADNVGCCQPDVGAHCRYVARLSAAGG